MHHSVFIGLSAVGRYAEEERFVSKASILFL